MNRHIVGDPGLTNNMVIGLHALFLAQQFPFVLRFIAFPCMFSIPITLRPPAQPEVRAPGARAYVVVSSCGDRI